VSALRRGPAGVVNRRAFLRAAGGIAIGLPFLESMPERSAWAQGQAPVFGFMLVAACGVVGSKFFPTSTGALTADGLRSSGKAVAALADHAPNLLFVKNLNFPTASPTGCGHVQGLVQSLTGLSSSGGDKNATSQGVSADVHIAKLVTPGIEPLTLYAGNKRNGYVVERISFNGAGAGQVRSADDNPYTLYNKLVTGGALSSGGGGGTPTNPMTDELVATRKSVNDLVREELTYLMNRPECSAADKARLDQHFQAIRDIEVTMGGMGEACSATGLSTTKLDAMKSGWAFQTNGMIEDVTKLHFELVAVAFACNYSRIATLQWGDATDKTMYDVASNSGLKWPFHYLSHRVQSDSTSGSNPTAENAHAEIDALRMQTLAYGLSQFKARGLQDKAYVMWTNHVADGPSHSMRNVPHIIWGNGGGYLKQGEFVDAGNVTNNRLLTTLISASVRDKGMTVTNFANASGELAAVKV
jgi:hypothetical protein